MGFLDNLENNLNALERQEERDPEKIKRDQERRESEREDALRRAPFIEALKTSPFTSELLTQCRIVGREARVLVRFTWLGDTLRLDAGPNRLDLVPEPQGIAAVFSVDGTETHRQRLDMSRDNPENLVRSWLTGKKE